MSQKSSAFLFYRQNYFHHQTHYSDLESMILLKAKHNFCNHNNRKSNVKLHKYPYKRGRGRMFTIVSRHLDAPSSERWKNTMVSWLVECVLRPHTKSLWAYFTKNEICSKSLRHQQEHIVNGLTWVSYTQNIAPTIIQERRCD